MHVWKHACSLHYANWPMSMSVVIWRNEKQKQKWFPVHDSSERQGLELHGQSYTLRVLLQHACSPIQSIGHMDLGHWIRGHSNVSTNFKETEMFVTLKKLASLENSSGNHIFPPFLYELCHPRHTKDTLSYWMQRYKVFIILTFLRELFFKTRENTEQNVLVKKTAHLAS